VGAIASPVLVGQKAKALIMKTGEIEKSGELEGGGGGEAGIRRKEGCWDCWLAIQEAEKLALIRSEGGIWIVRMGLAA
jgi:hypothetical protein